jgi:hypothetical protein
LEAQPDRSPFKVCEYRTIRLPRFWRSNLAQADAFNGKPGQPADTADLDERFHESDPMGFDPTFVIPGCVPAGDSRLERRPGMTIVVSGRYGPI